MNDCSYGFFRPRFTANFGVSLALVAVLRMDGTDSKRPNGVLGIVAILTNAMVCEGGVWHAQQDESLGGSL